jgi:hypothetical protein
MNRNTVIYGAAGVATSLVLVAALASPAFASTPDGTGSEGAAPPTTTSIGTTTEPATAPSPQQQSSLDRYLSSGTADSNSTPPLATVDGVRSAEEVNGKRLIHTRGSAQLWTQNSLEWYWNSSKITSSTGWQAVGYIFPNTAKAKGISRTYTSGSAHNWRGTVTIGIGAPTPWGDVDVYSSTVVDTYQLKRGGGFIVD